MFFLCAFLYSPVTIDGCMPPYRVRADLFQLRFEFGQGIVIEGVENILGGQPGITFQNNQTAAKVRVIDGVGSAK